jgi:hypothetical protein
MAKPKNAGFSDGWVQCRGYRAYGKKALKEGVKERYTAKRLAALRNLCATSRTALESLFIVGERAERAKPINPIDPFSALFLVGLVSLGHAQIKLIDDRNAGMSHARGHLLDQAAMFISLMSALGNLGSAGCRFCRFRITSLATFDTTLRSRGPSSCCMDHLAHRPSRSWSASNCGIA